MKNKRHYSHKCCVRCGREGDFKYVNRQITVRPDSELSQEAIYLTSPDGTVFEITVDDNGQLVSKEV